MRAHHPQNARLEFRNFGMGGDLAYNVCQRLAGIVCSKPSKVIVLIGGNDVLALVSNKARKFFRLTKRVPAEPSPEWFHENLHFIAHFLKTHTLADVALCSLIPIGEAPSTAEPFQAELNRRIAQYSQLIRKVAEDEGVG